MDPENPKKYRKLGTWASTYAEQPLAAICVRKAASRVAAAVREDEAIAYRVL
jgi:hypothetical protein